MKKIGLILLAISVLRTGLVQADLVDLDIYSSDTIDSGDYHHVNIYDTSPLTTIVDINGGLITRVNSYDGSVVNVYGVAGLSIASQDSSTVNIFGGEIICHYLGASHSSIINIYGGNIDVRNAPYINGTAAINIYGSNFNYDGNRVLTGTLSDGNDFVFGELFPYQYEQLNLIPEPLTLSLMGIGSCFILRNRNSR